MRAPLLLDQTTMMGVREPQRSLAALAATFRNRLIRQILLGKRTSSHRCSSDCWHNAPSRIVNVKMRVPIETLTSSQLNKAEVTGLVTPPPINTSNLPSGENMLAIYSGNDVNTMEIDFNCTPEGFLSNNGLVEIFPADILEAQEVFTAEKNEVVTAISENKQDVEEFSNVVVTEKREVQPVNQGEPKNANKLLGCSVRGRGRPRTSSRTNPLNSVSTSVGRGRMRQMVNQPVNGQIRTITSQSKIKFYSASQRGPAVVPAPSTSLMQTTQQEDWRMRNVRHSTRTSIAKTNRSNFPEMSTATEQSRWEDLAAGNNRKLPRMPVLLPRDSDRFPQFPQSVHEEGNLFIAVTFCQRCRTQKEHILGKPGIWPPNNCFNCGNKWSIVEWKIYDSEEDDDVVYAGEVINSNKPRVKKPPPCYGPNGVKIEPKEEFLNYPSCRQCGGFHNQYRGQPLHPGFCPHYNGSYSDWILHNSS